MSAVAVFDVGKTNVKLTAADPHDGHLLETLTTPNPTRAGPPYRHHDVLALEDWLLDGLRALGSRYAIDAIVPVGHGSGGVLVGPDGPAMPMIDYEQAPPPAVAAEYRTIAGPFRQRGSPVMHGATHLARQMLWLERGWPDAFAAARAFLALPQYWAWRLAGAAVSEVTSLAAQSHLWCSADTEPARLVAERGWRRLVPPLAPAWADLGPLKPDLATRTGLPAQTRVLTGIHDSSANLYRYQAAAVHDLTVVSTGTWIVAIGDRAGLDFDVERPGLCCNADVHGRPLPCLLTMAGRAFNEVSKGAAGPASEAALARLVASGTMALPSFGEDDALFPGTARAGRVEGPLADDPDSRFTLATLHAALLTDRCLASGPPTATVVLDGTFVRDPLYGALVSALNPERRVLVNLEAYGTAVGAALLASHEARQAPAPVALHAPPSLTLPGLAAYRDAWLDRAGAGVIAPDRTQDAT